MFLSNLMVSLVLMILLMAACSERLAVAQEPPKENLTDFGIQKSYTPITVMSRNVYMGTDLDVLLRAKSPEDIPILAAEALQTLLATNFEERAVLLAEDWLHFANYPKPKLKKSTLQFVKAEVTGDEISDKTSSWLWPSDHDGVVATFQFIKRGV